MSAAFNVIRDKRPVTGRWTLLEVGVRKLIASNFKNYADFQVLSNIKLYKPSMDESIFRQKTGEAPEIAEVYFKGNFLCDVTLADRPETALGRINDRMIELFTTKKGVL